MASSERNRDFARMQSLGANEGSGVRVIVNLDLTLENHPGFLGPQVVKGPFPLKMYVGTKRVISRNFYYGSLKKFLGLRQVNPFKRLKRRVPSNWTKNFMEKLS